MAKTFSKAQRQYENTDTVCVQNIQFAINYRLCSTSQRNLIDNKRPTEISVNRILIKVYRLNGQYYLSRKLMPVPLPLPVIVIVLGPMIIAYVHYQLPIAHAS